MSTGTAVRAYCVIHDTFVHEVNAVRSYYVTGRTVYFSEINESKIWESLISDRATGARTPP